MLLQQKRSQREDIKVVLVGRKEHKENYVKDKHIVEDESKPSGQRKRIDRGAFKGT